MRQAVPRGWPLYFRRASVRVRLGKASPPASAWATAASTCCRHCGYLCLHPSCLYGTCPSGLGRNIQDRFSHEVLFCFSSNLVQCAKASHRGGAGEAGCRGIGSAAGRLKHLHLFLCSLPGKDLLSICRGKTAVSGKPPAPILVDITTD